MFLTKKLNQNDANYQKFKWIANKTRQSNKLIQRLEEICSWKTINSKHINQFRFDYNEQQMQQVISQNQMMGSGVRSIKVNRNNASLSNSQRAQIADQKKAQMQAQNLNNNQMPQQQIRPMSAQQYPVQQQQYPIQQQQYPIQQKQQQPIQQQKFQQQQPIAQQKQQLPNKPIQKQQKIQKQQSDDGFFGTIKNYFNDVFSSDQPFHYVPVNKFDDDDDILYPENQQAKGQDINVEELIELRISTQYDYSKLKKSESQTLPAMVSIITKDLEQYAKNQSSIEAGIDLICVIDKSGSMSGAKIRSVQQSLVQLLDFLSEKDRLCLIVFNGGAQRHTPLKALTKDNKKYFKNAIAAIKADGSTNIAAGTKLAFQQILQRKMKNQVTSIFLLSDGQDSGADRTIADQKKMVEDVVTIHSFGYGNDHDAALMSAICKVGQGSFYYIQNVKLLDEFFADALGRLASAVAEKIQIDIKCAPLPPFEKIQVVKTFGEMWKQIDNGKFYQIQIPQIASDARKDFVFEIALPPYVDQISDEQRAPIVLQAFIQFKNTFSPQICHKSTQLQLKLYNEEEQIGENEPNQDVTREYLRVKATDAIGQARMQCEQSKNEDAEAMLEKLKQNILTDQKLAKVSAQAIADIDQAKNASKRQNFQQFGMKQMCQMSVNNYQQEGLNAQFDEVGGQMQQMEQGMFQNKKQLKMVQQVQKRKS